MEEKTYLRQFSIRLLLCLIFLLLVGFSLRAAAQNSSKSSFYSHDGEVVDPGIKLFRADAGAQEVVTKILSVVGLKPNFELRAANVPNAAAVLLDNKRYLLYNPAFIRNINAASGTNWAGISIMAHEIGHHLNGHTLEKGGSKPSLELESDEFSGFVLQKLGANQDQAQAAMQVAASQKSSHTHPARKDRLTAISSGWRNASGKDASKIAQPSRSKPVMVGIPAQNAPNFTEQHIAFDVYFHEDVQGEYYITQGGALVNVDGATVYTIAQLSESNRSGYRLMLCDKNYKNLYIAARGKLFNDRGKQVGYIDAH